MKVTGYESTILNITEDDPLANMPEESGRKRPIVILRLRTDAGIEGIGVTLWGGDLTASLRAAVDGLAALTVGEDPQRIEKIIAKLRAQAGICGQPMPLGRPPLPENEIQTIGFWIEALPH